jgi:hypothetical protein
MRRAVLACAIVFAACGAPEGGADRAHPTRPAADGDAVARLARELDPGAVPAIWPQLPEDVRARVEIDAPRDKAPELRLAAARERLGHWSLQLSTTELESVPLQLYRAFEGVYLAEPLALEGAEPTRSEARALLWSFYGAFAGTAPMLRSFQGSWVGTTPTKHPTPMAAAEVLAKAGGAMSDRLAALLLGGGATERVVADILWEHAGRRAARGDAAGGRALYTEFVRRSRSSASPGELLRIAGAYVRLEDARAASDAIAAAQAAAPSGDRSIQARLHAAGRERDALVRLLALPAEPSPETTLARFDLLLQLDRGKEAEALLAPLVAARPADARGRARQVQLRVRSGEVTEHLVDALRGEDLTDRDAAYWSMRIGAAGIAVAKSAPSRGALDELAAAGRELAKYEPGRAAALAFVVARVNALLMTKPDAASVLTSIRTGFDEAAALRARFPTTTDLDRIVLALAVFTGEPARGLEAALSAPKTPALEDPDLYLQRAQTVVTLAAYVGKGADLGAARRAVEEIPPSSDVAVEGLREALFGDLEVLAATTHGDRAALTRAAARYESAKALTKADVARLDNNLAFIAISQGDAARANALFEAAGRAKSLRRWVPLLNMATAPSASKEEQLAAIRAMSGAPDTELPGLLHVWRAALEPDASEAARAAGKALAELDGPLSIHKLPLLAEGLETEGTFALGLGLRSAALAYTFNANAYATLWLVRPTPLTHAELEAKVAAGNAAPAAKAAGAAPAGAAKKPAPAAKASGAKPGPDAKPKVPLTR